MIQEGHSTRSFNGFNRSSRSQVLRRIGHEKATLLFGLDAGDGSPSYDYLPIVTHT
jgi:hypothetical protein